MCGDEGSAGFARPRLPAHPLQVYLRFPLDADDADSYALRHSLTLTEQGECLLCSSPSAVHGICLDCCSSVWYCRKLHPVCRPCDDGGVRVLRRDFCAHAHCPVAAYMSYDRKCGMDYMVAYCTSVVPVKVLVGRWFVAFADNLLCYPCPTLESTGVWMAGTVVRCSVRTYQSEATVIHYGNINTRPALFLSASTTSRAGVVHVHSALPFKYVLRPNSR